MSDMYGVIFREQRRIATKFGLLEVTSNQEEASHV
jgi:hypothetical protein